MTKTLKTLAQRRFVLVYQAGIANVFEVASFNMGTWGREASRVYQGDFRTAEAIANGLGIGGHCVRSAHCNQAGDIAGAKWDTNLDDAPFSDKFRPVKAN
jgi:hypothetical protein